MYHHASIYSLNHILHSLITTHFCLTTLWRWFLLLGTILGSCTIYLNKSINHVFMYDPHAYAHDPAMSGSACRYPDRKHDPSAQRKVGCRYPQPISRIEIPPDLRAFFDGNHLYMSQHFDADRRRKTGCCSAGRIENYGRSSCLEYAGTVFAEGVTFMCASWNCGTAEISSVIIWLQ